MSDLIDRERLHEYLDNYYKEVENRCVGTHKDAGCTIISCIDNTVMTMPTVEERKHGRWIDYPHGSGSYCSCCKFKIRYKDKKRFRLCPDCGAIMDEVSEDE